MQALEQKRNVEIKCKVRPSKFAELGDVMLAHYATDYIGNLQQTDTFFATNDGSRLKLRQEGEQAQLIRYVRANEACARESSYTLQQLTDSEVQALLASQPTTIVVRKQRELYVVGQVRIHLDRVERLGEFVEIEVVLHPNDSLEHGQTVLKHWMVEVLALNDSTICKDAYADLLAQQ